MSDPGPNGVDQGSAVEPARAKANWSKAKGVLHKVQASEGFVTLRDRVGDAFIDQTQLAVVKRLGEGAFATVDLAELTTRAKQLVAVKTIKPELLADETELANFIGEVKLFRKLKHKHIVAYIGFGGSNASAAEQLLESGAAASPPPAGASVYIVQEFAAGGSLKDLVMAQMQKPFQKLYSDADALRWSLQLAEALRYLHNAQPTVIHRDLKLDNVLATDPTPGLASAKLADFGLAKLLARARLEQAKAGTLRELANLPEERWPADMRAKSMKLVAGLSSSLGSSQTANSLVGTTPSGLAAAIDLTGKTGSFAYMAPEVVLEKPYGEKADVFSFGMVMYNLFMRTIPSVQIILCGDEGDLELYALKVAYGYRPPFNANVPKEVKDVIEHCWKGDPELRPNMYGVVEALKAVRDAGVCGASEADLHQAAGCKCSIM